MTVRIAKQEDKRAYYTMLSYCFNMGNSNTENNVQNANFPHDEVLVNEIDGTVTQCVHVVPFDMNFEGKSYKMGGIAGVSSMPEHRDQGGIKDILVQSLSYMKERGMIFSALGPFSFEFYRKYGWEWGFTFQKLKFPISAIAKTPKAKKYVQLTQEDDELVNNFRNEFIKKINGSIYHTEKIRNERWQRFNSQFVHCYASYDDNNQVEAIAFFKIEGRTLNCEEFFFKNETARQHMLHFFYVHRSQVDEIELQLLPSDNFRTLLPSPRIQYWEWANMMFRVVVVEEAFRAMNLNQKLNGKFRLKVIDSQADWNDGIFDIQIQKGKLEISKSNSKNYDFEISIQRLSQLILGFMSGKEAIDLETVLVKNENKKALFMELFTKRPTMLWLMF